MGFLIKTNATKAKKDVSSSGRRRKRRSTQEERSVSKQIASLEISERECFRSLKQKWRDEYPTEHLDDQQILLFARCAPAGPFHEASAWKVMKNFDTRYLTLTANGLERQLSTKTLFPVPGLTTIEGNEVFYMFPARYNPKQTPTQDVIDNLVYVMHTMNERENNATNGIAFLANMNGWTWENFSVEYCYNFMMALQGFRSPTKVTHFFIVNPPSWFGQVWTIMKGMLVPSFRRKVKMIPESKLSKYLVKDYECFLPNDFSTGVVSTREIVQDFIDARRQIEPEREHVPATAAAPAKESSSSATSSSSKTTMSKDSDRNLMNDISEYNDRTETGHTTCSSMDLSAHSHCSLLEL